MKNNKINILFIISSAQIAGAEFVVLDLVKNLNRDRYNVFLAIPEGPIVRDFEKTQTTIFKIRPYFDLDFIYLWKLIRIIQKNKIDLLHCHKLKASIFGRLVGKLTKRPVICTLHGYMSRWSINPLKKRLDIYFDRLTSNHFSTAEIAVSEATKKDMVTAGIYESKIKVIYNGIDLTKFKPKDNQVKNENLPVIGSIAYITAQKGFDVLLEAAKIIIKIFPNVQFRIYGEGPLKLHLIKIAEKMNLSKNVKFNHSAEYKELPKILSSFSIFVLPSRCESFGRVLVEAQACGIPVVATDIEGIPEVVKNNFTGLLVPPNYSEKFAEAIIKLLENKELANKMGQAGIENAKNFSKERFISEHEKLFELVVKNKKVP